jgi:hypothetical protein
MQNQIKRELVTLVKSLLVTPSDQAAKNDIVNFLTDEKTILPKEELSNKVAEFIFQLSREIDIMNNKNTAHNLKVIDDFSEKVDLTNKIAAVQISSESKPGPIR